MTASRPACRAQGLTRRFGALSAVTALDLEVAQGEVLALLGPNGAGKTTTLSMLTGNLALHAGWVRIGGHDLAAAPRLAKRSLGYLPELPPLYPDMRVAAYLAWCAGLHGIRRGERARAVDEVCERTGLAKVKKRLIAHLSKGYRQRVGIAQAIVHRPALVVLDEPTAGLDPVQSRETRELIGSLRASAGVIFSTHLLAEASAVADRVAILHRGRIVQELRLNGEGEGAEPTRFRLQLARPPEPRRIADLPGVSQVETLADGAFLVTPAAPADPRETLARAALDNDWGLLALAAHRPSLEDVFLRIVNESDAGATMDATAP